MEFIREENVNDGPKTEVRFWKRRMSRLNSLIQKLSHSEVVNLVTVLELAQSKTLEVILQFAAEKKSFVYTFETEFRQIVPILYEDFYHLKLARFQNIQFGYLQIIENSCSAPRCFAL